MYSDKAMVSDYLWPLLGRNDCLGKATASFLVRGKYSVLTEVVCMWEYKFAETCMLKMDTFYCIRIIYHSN